MSNRVRLPDLEDPLGALHWSLSAQSLLYEAAGEFVVLESLAPPRELGLPLPLEVGGAVDRGRISCGSPSDWPGGLSLSKPSG